MSKIPIILSFIFCSLTVQATPGGRCTEAFKAHYHEGQAQKSRVLWDVFRLGAGEMGGTVRRIINKKTKASELEKDYYTPDSLFNDVIALKILKELVGGDFRVKVLQPLKVIRDEKLHFPDVKGYALDKVPSEVLKERLTKEFKYWAHKVFDRAKLREDMETNMLGGNEFWMSYTVPEGKLADFHGMRVIDILLKPDNIIVDSQTHQMFLFDPY